MGQVTQQYNRSFSGSVGAGMGSLLNASGRTYYILEHKISSKYHQAGESQKIIIDRIEIGRDPGCQVRFDEAFPTVSRRHAAIMREGEHYKLIRLSQTNTTLLNGKPVNTEWYLQNGDEIQLSVNGPKLGFIIPNGKQSLVSSIKFTERLQLFNEQAMRPYRFAVVLLGILLGLVMLGTFGWGYRQYHEWRKDSEWKEKQVTVALDKNTMLEKQVDSLKNLPDPEPQVITQIVAPPAIEDIIEKYKDDIYVLSVREVYLLKGTDKKQIMFTNHSGEQQPYQWNGTGFLLEDGRLVTARHCIQEWRFSDDLDGVLNQVAMADSYPDTEVIAVINATSRTGKTFQFKSTDFICNDSYDQRGKLEGSFEEDIPVYLKSASLFENTDERVFSTDWAYVRTSNRGKLKADQVLSQNLRSGTELHVLGFPMRMNAGNIASNVSPNYDKFNVASDGLDRTGCFLYTKGGGSSGNTGSPVLIQKGDEMIVIGVVSGWSGNHQNYNYGIPVSIIK